jgi:DNA-directed RNA polymerase subunit RPC12/RpoP
MTEASTSEHRFPCQQCGSDLRYEPGTDQLSCDHCGSVWPIEGASVWQEGAIRELDFRRAIEGGLSDLEMSEIQTISCENCGAHVEFEPGTHAAECPFCATPIVTGTGAERQIKPRGLLPFELDERAARKQMNDWLGGLWFAPNGLQAYARKGRRLQGIYVPFWTYDADTKSHYTGQRGTVYYVKRGDKRVAKVRWRGVSGRVARFFDDVLVLATRSLPKKYTDALAPWDLSRMEPYQPEFLAGFRAEGYTLTLEEGYDQARAYMDRMIVRDIKFDIGGDRQRIHSVRTEVRDVTFKHILLPVWMAAYKYRGKTYRFVVNGQTGAVQGERPYSAIKIAFAVLLGLIVAGIWAYLSSNG